MEDRYYRAYEYYKNPLTDEYTDMPGRIIGYVKAQHSFEALKKLDLEGNEYNAESIDGKQFERDLKAIEEEAEFHRKLREQIAPLKEEYDKAKAEWDKKVEEAWEEHQAAKKKPKRKTKKK